MKAIYTPGEVPKPVEVSLATITVTMTEAEARAIAHALCGFNGRSYEAPYHSKHPTIFDVEMALNRFRSALTVSRGLESWL